MTVSKCRTASPRTSRSIDTYLSADINVHDDCCRLPGNLRVPLSCAERDHLVGTCDDLDGGLPVLDSLPLEFFQERGVVVTPVYEGMGDAGVRQSLEDDRCRAIHVEVEAQRCED